MPVTFLSCRLYFQPASVTFLPGIQLVFYSVTASFYLSDGGYVLPTARARYVLSHVGYILLFSSSRFLFCPVLVTFLCIPCFGFVSHRMYALTGGYVFSLVPVTFSHHNRSLHLSDIGYVLSSCRLRLASGIPARSDYSLSVTVLPHAGYILISCRLHVYFMWVTIRLWLSCPLRHFVFFLVSVTFLPHSGCIFT